MEKVFMWVVTLLLINNSDLRDELENRPVVSEWRVEVEKV